MGELLVALWLILIGVWLGVLINTLARDSELAEFIQWFVLLLFAVATFVIMIVC